MNAVRAETKAGLFKHRHKTSDFIKDREFRDKMSDQKLFKDSPVPRTFYDIYPYGYRSEPLNYHTFGHTAHHSGPSLFLELKIAIYKR
jgi:hypothetical protein